MNLIEQLGGYENAKKEFIKASPDQYRYKFELQMALLEYRRKHNIFEMGDWIVYEDEIMVFAMWSECIEGCAYIGYAYAEDGFLVNRGEFRHATPDEIGVRKILINHCK